LKGFGFNEIAEQEGSEFNQLPIRTKRAKRFVERLWVTFLFYFCTHETFPNHRHHTYIIVIFLHDPTNGGD
jgi:hypothetical protein